MILSIVVATGINGEIGKDNKLLWHLPADLKYFKNLTSGHPIIMGRHTFESIGRALPNRRNIVITRQQDLKIEGVDVVHSLEEAIALVNDQEEVMVIGGADVYKQALPPHLHYSSKCRTRSRSLFSRHQHGPLDKKCRYIASSRREKRT